MPPSSAREHAGQALILGFDGLELSPSTRELLRAVQPAGVILFARNIESPQQTHALLRECRRVVQLPLFCCVDMEGGAVDRLKLAVEPAPSPATVFSSGRSRAFRRHGQLIAAECRALGFNVDFAPVCDLALPPSRPVLGERAVSADPAAVTRYARAFLAGLAAGRILGCAKHFPGLGGAALDTHRELPHIARSARDLWQNDLLPFRRLHRHCPLIMVGHASYACAEKAAPPAPASLSRHWITGVLRRRLGFRGLIITDDLEMGAVAAVAPPDQAAVAAIAAGADLALVCHREASVGAAWEALVRRAEADSAFRRRLAEAHRRVTAFKARRPALAKLPPPPSPATVARLRLRMREFQQEISTRSPAGQAAP